MPHPPPRFAPNGAIQSQAVCLRRIPYVQGDITKLQSVQETKNDILQHIYRLRPAVLAACRRRFVVFELSYRNDPYPSTAMPLCRCWLSTCSKLPGIARVPPDSSGPPGIHRGLPLPGSGLR